MVRYFRTSKHVSEVITLGGHFLQFFSAAPIPSADRSPAYLTGDFGLSALCEAELLQQSWI